MFPTSTCGSSSCGNDTKYVPCRFHIGFFRNGPSTTSTTSNSVSSYLSPNWTPTMNHSFWSPTTFTSTVNVLPIAGAGPSSTNVGETSNHGSVNGRNASILTVPLTDGSVGISCTWLNSMHSVYHMSVDSSGSG